MQTQTTQNAPKSAATPGPWLTKTDVFGGDRAYIQTADGSTTIAEAFASVKISYADRVANARLLAAAPELLDALEQMANHFEAFGVKPRADSFSQSESVYAAVLAAIAKATGGAL